VLGENNKEKGEGGKGKEKKTRGKTKIRQRTDGEKNMDDICRPYLIQRVLAAPNIGNPCTIREICGN
jgi:hypothetical protein